MTVLRALTLVLWLAVVPGCSPTAAPSASAPSAAPPSLQEEPAKPPEKTGELARPDRPAAAPVVSPEVHLIRTSGSARGPIPYLTVEPSEAPNETPIVIALHGRGARADSFARLTEGLRVPARFIVGRGPLPWGATGGRQWFGPRRSAPFEGIEDRVEELVTLADQLQAQYPGSPKPILLGFSQGAMLAMQAVAAKPERFAKVVALSGALPRPEAGVKASKAVPMLLTAGKFDTIVPPESTQSGAQRLKELGHAPQVVVFEGAHSVARELIPQIRAFLTDPSVP